MHFALLSVISAHAEINCGLTGIVPHGQILLLKLMGQLHVNSITKKRLVMEQSLLLIHLHLTGGTCA
jgi:hypothetical protein